MLMIHYSHSNMVACGGGGLVATSKPLDSTSKTNLQRSVVGLTSTMYTGENTD